jgi:hypothetical protein
MNHEKNLIESFGELQCLNNPRMTKGWREFFAADVLSFYELG